MTTFDFFLLTCIIYLKFGQDTQLEGMQPWLNLLWSINLIPEFLCFSESNEEKRVRCLQLLEFCAEHPQLRNNKIFTDFFSDVETPKSEAEVEADGVTQEPASPASDVIRLLSKEGNIFQAAAVSTELVINFISPLLGVCQELDSFKSLPPPWGLPVL